MVIYLVTRVTKWYNLLDMVLAYVLKSKYIHSELYFPDKKNKKQRSFSSRGRTKNMTPRFKGVNFAHVNYKKGKWVWNEILVSYYSYNDIMHRCYNIVGKGYDIAGAVGNCGFGLPIDDREKFWCSEAIAYVLGLKYDNLTPRELRETILNRKDSKYEN